MNAERWERYRDVHQRWNVYGRILLLAMLVAGMPATLFLVLIYDGVGDPRFSLRFVIAGAFAYPIELIRDTVVQPWIAD